MNEFKHFLAGAGAVALFLGLADVVVRILKHLADLREHHRKVLDRNKQEAEQKEKAKRNPATLDEWVEALKNAASDRRSLVSIPAIIVGLVMLVVGNDVHSHLMALLRRLFSG